VRRWRWRLALAALVVAGGFALAVRAQGPSPGPASPPPAQAPAPAAPAAKPGPPSSTVKITFITVPMKKATVLWGKRKLGLIAPRQPLVVERPRDSGPLDVVVQSDGYLSVQTRAYTFGDSKVAVKLTPLDQQKTLLGYREEVPSPDGGAPEGVGAPPPAPPFAASPDGGAR
jgi:hypothetical protein